METSTIEGNKLIAKFMGVDPGDIQIHFPFFQYDCEWAEIMQVVEKIEILDFNVKIDTNYCVISKYSPVSTIFNQENNKIKMTWQAVVEFIQWYNKQAQK